MIEIDGDREEYDTYRTEVFEAKCNGTAPQPDAAAAHSTAVVLDMDTDTRRPSYIHKAATTPVFHKKK